MNRILKILLVAISLGLIRVSVLLADGLEPGLRPFLRGALAEAEGNWATAFAFYSEAARLDHASPTPAQAASLAALVIKNIDEAHRFVTQAIAQDSTNSKLFVLQGRIYLAAWEISRAQASFERALELDPSDTEAMVYAVVNRQTSDPEGARQLVRQFLANNPQSREAHARLAELDQRLGNLKKAEGRWKDILRSDPADNEALWGLVQLYETRQDTTSLVGVLESLKSVEPDNPEVYLKLGQLYVGQGRGVEAEKAFSQLAALAPRAGNLDFWRALAAEAREDWVSAAHFMEKQVQTAPDSAGFLRLSTYWDQLDKPQKSVAALRRLQKMDRTNPDYMFYLAMGYENLGKPRKALKWLQKAQKQAPNRSEILFHLATNWDALGHFDRAEPLLLETIQKDPLHHLAMNYLSYSWAEKGLHLDKALALVQQALALNTDNTAYQDTLGWVYFKLNRSTEAVSVLSDIVIRARDPVVWEHYGDALLQLGKKEEARRAWQEGLLLDPHRQSLRQRLGPGAAFDFVQPHTASRTLLKRVEANFRSLRSLSGHVGLTLHSGPFNSEVEGLFYYTRPQQFRLEILGPLWLPEALWVSNTEGVHWRTTHRDWPTPDDRWVPLLGEMFSGTLFGKFDRPDTRVEEKSGRLIYSAPMGRLAIDGREKTLRDVWWQENSASEEIHFRLADYVEEEGIWLPQTVEAEGLPQARITLVFRRWTINAALDQTLFQTPP